MTDRSTVQLVIWWLGALALILTTGVVAAILLQLPIPDPMWSIVSTLYGALAALLVSTRSGPADPAPVQVTNGPDNPVNVEDAPDAPLESRRRRKRITLAKTPPPDPEGDPA